MAATVTCDWQLVRDILKLCPVHKNGDCVESKCKKKKRCRHAVFDEVTKSWVGKRLYEAMLVSRKVDRGSVILLIEDAEAINGDAAH
jgi:hypothetical protein